MYKPDDKDIDRLSRDAAEHYHAPGKPEWDALQQILDKELPQEKEKKRRGFFFFFLLLLGISVAGSGVWYGLQKINHENKVTEGTDNTNAPTKTVNKSGEGNTVVPDVKTLPAADASKHEAFPDSKKTDYTDKTKTGNSVTAVPATTATKPTSNSINNNEPDKAENTAAVKNNPGFANKNTAAVSASKNQRAPKTNRKTAEDAVVTNTDEKVSGTVKNNPVYGATTGRKTHPQQHLYKGITNSGNEDAVKTTIEKNSGTKKTRSAYTTTARQHKQHQKASADISPVLANENKDKLEKNAAGNKLDGNTDATITTDLAAGDYHADNTKRSNVLPGKKDITAVAEDAAAVDGTAGQPVRPDSQLVNPAKTGAAVTAKKKAKSKNEKAINIGLTAGLDVSTVRFTYGDNAGYNFGITGGYQFNKHWSAYTGVIYTKKNYKLNGSDYHPPKHYWTQYVNLQMVEGYCRMWEVPLLARYTFNPGSKTAYFASAGMSSYIMKKQAYDYSYKDASGWAGTAAWTNDSTFNHVFSILSLSAGFEKSFGKHMNWQIEPYAKIPLGGVGFGNIKLSSFGINLTVQYRHPVKR